MSMFGTVYHWGSERAVFDRRNIRTFHIWQLDAGINGSSCILDEGEEHHVQDSECIFYLLMC